MSSRHTLGAVAMMHDDNINAVTAERLERRLGEECGKLRLDIGGVRLEVAAVRQEMAAGFGNLRAEIEIGRAHV